mmetsp:Transcript_38952/g.120381  ORF Transcript_38952/g.120381 Transcript_38952/m.120381 type:complete len:419 (-) Transcript_38952:714-1970(-)
MVLPADVGVGQHVFFFRCVPFAGSDCSSWQEVRGLTPVGTSRACGLAFCVVQPRWAAEAVTVRREPEDHDGDGVPRGDAHEAPPRGGPARPHALRVRQVGLHRQEDHEGALRRDVPRPLVAVLVGAHALALRVGPVEGDDEEGQRQQQHVAGEHGGHVCPLRQPAREQRNEGVGEEKCEADQGDKRRGAEGHHAPLLHGLDVADPRPGDEQAHHRRGREKVEGVRADPVADRVQPLHPQELERPLVHLLGHEKGLAAAVEGHRDDGDDGEHRLDVRLGRHRLRDVPRRLDQRQRLVHGARHRHLRLPRRRSQLCERGAQQHVVQQQGPLELPRVLVHPREVGDERGAEVTHVTQAVRRAPVDEEHGRRLRQLGDGGDAAGVEEGPRLDLHRVRQDRRLQRRQRGVGRGAVIGMCALEG